jgi:hypothetical protein
MGRYTFLIHVNQVTRKRLYSLGKGKISDHRQFGFGNTSRRFAQSKARREKGEVAKDRFAFEQAMKGNDCSKILRDGEFVVQERDAFGNTIGKPTIYKVKSGNSKLTDAEEKRKRQLGRDRYKIVRY